MKTCFLCGTGGKVIDFSYETFRKCKLLSLFRKVKNFKYGDTTVNRDLVDVQGYHLACYKKFTPLKRKYKEEFLVFCATQTVSKIIFLSFLYYRPLF